MGSTVKWACRGPSKTLPQGGLVAQTTGGLSAALLYKVPGDGHQLIVRKPGDDRLRDGAKVDLPADAAIAKKLAEAHLRQVGWVVS